MTPAQVRMARAAVNWSLDQLVQAAGVHRNTIHNFETGRYSGSPEKLRAAPTATQTTLATGLAVAGTAGAAAALGHSVLVVNSVPEVRSLASSILEELSLNMVETENGE